MITRAPIRLEDHIGNIPETCGAVVTFTGMVRSPHEGREVTGVFYDCYDEMAERALASVVAELKAAHPITDVRIVHRVGELGLGEISLLVVVIAPHRREAFVAATRAVDDIKRRVPIWKKERYADNHARWL
jgi:molybdopterin synthase catalytic subunit